jgi:hypothetical protein
MFHRVLTAILPGNCGCGEAEISRGAIDRSSPALYPIVQKGKEVGY